MGRDGGSALGEGARECKSWRWLLDKIADLFQVPCCRLFPEASPKVKWEVRISPPNFGIDLYRAEKPFRVEIEAAIRALSSGQSVSVSPEVRYFLGVRARAVQWFLSWFEIDQCWDPDVELSQTIIPFPDGLPSREIIRWLMFDWFNNNGAHIAALLQLGEMHLNPENPT
jgi:hypothetical protein